MKTLLAPLAIAAVVLLIATPSHANTPSAATPAHTTPAVTTTPEDTGIQLADEITRRIRRLGINVIRFPNSRPSEFAGEIC